MATPREIAKGMQERLEGLVEGIDQIGNSGFRTNALSDARSELIWRIHTDNAWMNHSQIAISIGIDRTTVTYWLSKDRCNVGGIVGRMNAAKLSAKREAEEKRKEEMGLRYYSKTGGRSQWFDPWHPRTVEALEREEQVRLRLLERKRHEQEMIDRLPPDVRSITGRICGDPLPGRSALDKRRAAA